MKNLESLVPPGHTFVIDEENPFLISQDDIRHIFRIGELVYTLLQAAMKMLRDRLPLVSGVLFEGLGGFYRELSAAHPEMCPTLIRVDLMVDEGGNWKIAEIDPANKHGMGFALATRYESGAGERQKLLTLLGAHVADDVTIVLSRQETFFRFEQRFLAEKLAAHTGKKVTVIPEEKVAKRLNGGLVLDLPRCSSSEAEEALGRRFMENPKSFINPPRHVLGSKALMTLPYEHEQVLAGAGMEQAEIAELKTYLPPTYLGPFIGKEVHSSGAKGVFFDAVEKKTVFQRYIRQRRFLLGGTQRYIRMACFFVGPQLGEVIVSANTELPVHGGNTAVHYHVNVK